MKEIQDRPAEQFLRVAAPNSLMHMLFTSTILPSVWISMPSGESSNNLR